MHALWAVVGAGPLDPTFHLALLSHRDPALRAWGVRAAGNAGDARPAILDRIRELSLDPSLDVSLQVAVASKKIRAIQPIPILLDVLSACGDDPLIPHIVWQNLHPMLDDPKAAQEVVIHVGARTENLRENVARLVPRVVERLVRGEACPQIMVWRSVASSELLLCVRRKNDVAGRGSFPAVPGDAHRRTR